MPDAAIGTRPFLYDRDLAVPTMLELAGRDDPAAAFVPTAAAALSFGGERRVGWYGRWVAEEAGTLLAEHPGWLVTTALPQAVAMLTHPHAPQWPWREDLLAAVRRTVEDMVPWAVPELAG